MLFSLQAMSNKNCLLSICPFPGRNNRATFIDPNLLVESESRYGEAHEQPCPEPERSTPRQREAHLKLNVKHTHARNYEANQSRRQSSGALFAVTARTLCVCVCVCVWVGMCALVFIMCAYGSERALIETLKRSTPLYSTLPPRQQHAFELALSAAEPSIMLTGTWVLWVWHRRSPRVEVLVFADINWNL